jgi:hypothetical protein
MWRVVSHSLLFVILLSTRRVIPKTLMTPEVRLPACLPAIHGYTGLQRILLPVVCMLNLLI